MGQDYYIKSLSETVGFYLNFTKIHYPAMAESGFCLTQNLLLFPGCLLNDAYFNSLEDRLKKEYIEIQLDAPLCLCRKAINGSGEDVSDISNEYVSIFMKVNNLKAISFLKNKDKVEKQEIITRAELMDLEE